MHHTTELLTSFYERYKRMPSYAELAKLFGFKSKNAAYKLVGKLIDEGIIEKDRNGKLLPGTLFDSIPFMGLVKAGPPSEAFALSDTLNLESYLLPKKSSSYLFEVEGDSMIEAHIAEGDMVIAERTTQAKEGAIVIARVDGEYTMKYLRKEEKGNRMYLEPANKKYTPIYPKEELVIVAVVRSVVRKY